MGYEISGSYDASLVLLSFAIAIVASFTALDLAGRVQSALARSRLLWLLGGALAMGTGIWSMHFIAMLAFQLPLSVNYDLLTTLLSLVYAIIASGIALWLLSRPVPSLFLLLSGGICMGLAIAWMHYTNMAAMQLQASLSYDWLRVGLSVAIAVSASLAALWLSFRLQDLPAKAQLWQKLGSAIVMGLAVSGMHYTGMWATHFLHRTDLLAQQPSTLDQPRLALYIAIATLFLLGLTLLTSLFDQHLTNQLVRQEALQESEKRFRTLVREMQVAVLLYSADAEILMSNRAAANLFKLEETGDGQQVLSSQWRFLREDGTLFRAEELPVQQAIAQRQPIHNIVIGLALGDDSIDRWLLVNADPQIAEDGSVERVISTFSDITEQKCAETALQQSTEQFSKAFHSNPIASCITTLANGYFLDVNTSFLKLLGYSREDIINRTSIELGVWANPTDRDQLLQALQHQPSVQLDAPFRTSSGEVREGMSSFERIELRGQECLLSMIYDVTARKQAEAEQVQQMKLTALRAAIGTILTEGKPLQEMLEWCAIALHQHLDVTACMWMLNRAEQVLECQSSAGSHFFDEVEQSVPVGHSRVGWVAQHRQPYLTDFSTPHNLDLDLTKPEGTAVFAGYPLAIQDRLLGVVSITACQPLPKQTLEELASVASAIAVGIDRRLAEEALRKTAERERAIAGVIQRMRQTLDLKTIFSTTTQELRQAICCDRVLVYRFNTDWSGSIIAESVAAGWSAVLQDPHSTFPLAETTSHDRCIVKTWNTSHDLEKDTYLRETQGGAFNQGTFYRCINDTHAAGFDPCYVELLKRFQARAYIIVPIFLGTNLWGLLAAYQNSGARRWDEADVRIVTQIGAQLGVALKQAELLAQTQRQSIELRSAKEAADAANSAKTEFLANTSHELRTPLNAILGFTQLINQDTTLASEHRQHLAIISQSGEHLLTLINDILEMSKIETGKTTLNETNFNLHHLLEALEDMMQLKARSKGLRLSFECDMSVPQWVRTDASKLRQVLINLLGNAIKFTQKGSVTLRVRTQSRIDASAVSLHFEIQDTGYGIAPDELDRLFQPFSQTTSGIRSCEGTGLGLPITQKSVQLMGGDIHVSSQLGQGSVFAFKIVVSRVRATPATSSQPDFCKVTQLAPNQPRYRILVVDDAPTNRLILMRLLGSLGFEMREAENGQDAIAIWQNWQPHLIWMDIRMPIMDGYEATHYIKALPQGHVTTVIALTASAFEEQRQQILSAGCDDFVRKPFRVAEVLEKLAKHLGVRYLYSA